jgi:radical SAM protein with 4Fe4S-binding SPASM domain
LLLFRRNGSIGGKYLLLGLRDNWALVKDPEYFYLVEMSNFPKTWFALEWQHFLALVSLDGTKPEQEIVKELSETCRTPFELAARIVRQLIRRFGHCIEEKTNRNPSTPPVYTLHEYLMTSQFKRVRNCAPARLTWIVTTHCPKQCRYCYMDALPVNQKETKPPVEALKQIAREAESLAIPELILTGGEPLLAPEIYEVINHFMNSKVRVKVTTKNKVNTRKLIPPARNYLQVEQSLDSDDPALVSYLTGKGESFDEAIDSMREMSARGILFYVKMVMGRLNHQSIPAMALLSKKMGAKGMQITEYRPSFGRNIPDFELTELERIEIQERVRKIEQAVNIEINLDLAFQKPNIQLNNFPGEYCGEGIHTLSFLPGGECTRCPSLPYDREITSGNIFEEGIYQCWNSNEGYQSLIFPDKELFKGTDCFQCAGFDRCNLSGRCIVKSRRRSARSAGPDRFCEPNLPG